MVAWHAAGDRAGNLFTAFVRAGSEAGCQEQQFAAEVRDQPLGDVVARMSISRCWSGRVEGT